MEKTDDINPNVYAKVKKIIDELQDPKTGVWGLKNAIFGKLSEKLSNEFNALIKEYKSDKKSKANIDAYIYYIVLNAIDDFENKPDIKSKSELTQSERETFEKAVYEEFKKYLTDRTGYTKSNNPDGRGNLDQRRTELTPEKMIKYRYFSSCGNAADVFAYKNDKLGGNSIPLKFLHSTRWDHLIDGEKGHTILMIQISDGRWVALDPQVLLTKDSPDVKFITSELKEGNKVYHLLSGHENIPYMITKITDKDYTDHEIFMEEASKVPYNKAKEFLDTISDNEVNADELAKYKEQISQEYIEKMKKAVKDVKKLNQEAQNQQLQQAVYVNKNQND